MALLLDDLFDEGNSSVVGSPVPAPYRLPRASRFPSTECLNHPPRSYLGRQASLAGVSYGELYAVEDTEEIGAAIAEVLGRK
jgi:hypothetical protein